MFPRGIGHPHVVVGGHGGYGGDDMRRRSAIISQVFFVLDVAVSHSCASAHAHEVGADASRITTNA
jgi:hypothetical protein